MVREPDCKARKSIIIDTDPGIDDALAIMLAVRSERFTIDALTTVAGNSTVENTTANARYVLHILGREDIPVHSGAEKPSEYRLETADGPAGFHGERALAGIVPDIAPRLTGDAVERIIERASESPDEITLVALGPLTNIAQAIEQDPEVMKHVKEIVIMGGSLYENGFMNENGTADFNMYTDPHAAKIVFEFPVKKTLVPLDATNGVRMTREDFDRVEIRDSDLAETVIQLSDFWLERFEEGGEPGIILYDVLTVYAMINPDACQSSEYTLRVETEGRDRGRTMPDDCGSPVKVVEHIDAEEFIRDFISYFSN